MKLAADRVEADKVVDREHIGEIEAEFGVQEDAVEDGESGVVAAGVNVGWWREDRCALAFEDARVEHSAVDAVG